MINIIEYDSGMGSMTWIGGIEDGKNFLVRKNIALNSENEHIYNNNHFLDHYLNIDNDIPSLDLFIASPFFGDKLKRRGSSNFDTTELNECLAYISLHLPPYVLISVYGSAITPLQIDFRVTETYDGIPTNDLIIGKMNEMGYDVQNIILDTATYRLPQVKIIGLYYCWKKNDSVDPISVPGFSEPDEECYVGRWLKSCRNMHPVYGRKDWSKKDICSKIKPGENAARTKDISITKGYARLKPDMQCSNLGVEFYKVSGSGWCIHPEEDRPLTIEEGALLSGIPTEKLVGLNVSKREAASMIFRSVSPIIGNKIRMGLLDSIG